MIFSETFFDLTPAEVSAVNGSEQLEASRDSSLSKAGCSDIYPARAGDVLSAHSSNSELKGTIIDHARRVVVKELIELYGDDIPCVRKFQKYLLTLSLSDLHARREQLFKDRLPRFPKQMELGDFMIKDGGKL